MEFKAIRTGKEREMKKVDLKFFNELMQLLNRYSKESDSNTPDMLLTEYLIDCLNAYAKITNGRDKWFGFKPSNSLETNIERKEK
jgi:hypothetical protein